MLGCPMPCGVALTRKKHVAKVGMSYLDMTCGRVSTTDHTYTRVYNCTTCKVEMRIDYLNSLDTTIMGSRNGQVTCASM